VGRRNWVLLLLGVGIVAVIVLGVLGAHGSRGTSSTGSQESLCSSLESFKDAAVSLTSLSLQTASKSQLQSVVGAIQAEWGQVEGNAGDVSSKPMRSLDAAWNGFQHAADTVPSDAAPSTALRTVSESAKALATATQSTLTSLKCS
jgi:hypothetical protein